MFINMKVVHMHRGKLKFKENKILKLDTEYVCWLTRKNLKVGGRKGIWEREVRHFFPNINLTQFQNQLLPIM